MMHRVSDRLVYFISDGTGITAETIGHSLLTQFGGLRFDTRRLAFIDNEEKARAAATLVREQGRVMGCRPIIISSVVNEPLSAILAESGALVDFDAYEERINATNYALTHDDGMNTNYDEADLILVGVSRSGKTPTCLYLALQYGVCAANYPLTEDDLEGKELPSPLDQYRQKLYGLTIDPNRLRQIRQQRKPDSRYATLDQCIREVAAAEVLLRGERIPMLSTTHTSIEEIASKVLSALGIERHMF